MERVVVPLETREKWVRESLAAGVDIVQVGSFVHPEKVPQMAGTDELFRLLAADRPKGLLSGLVLNEKGLERALACGASMVCVGASASDTHSRKNSGMGSDEAARRIAATARQALAAGLAVQASVQSAFGCGFEGPVDEDRVVDMARVYVDAGVTAISLADTAGHATPSQVERLFGAVLELAPGVEATCHFHNTYGVGMANVVAALRAGVTTIETSFGGLGGCPFTRVAAGNVATEDLVHLLQREGLREDIDLPRLVALARVVEAFFGRELPGCVHRAGPIQAAAAV
jgi:hydroxymethylglutaryl-CoA lyase